MQPRHQTPTRGDSTGRRQNIICVSPNITPTVAVQLTGQLIGGEIKGRNSRQPCQLCRDGTFEWREHARQRTNETCVTLPHSGKNRVTCFHSRKGHAGVPRGLLSSNSPVSWLPSRSSFSSAVRLHSAIGMAPAERRTCMTGAPDRFRMEYAASTRRVPSSVLYMGLVLHV